MYAARLFNIKSEKRRINRPSKYRQLKKSVKISSVKNSTSKYRLSKCRLSEIVRQSNKKLPFSEECFYLYFISLRFVADVLLRFSESAFLFAETSQFAAARAFEVDAVLVIIHILGLFFFRFSFGSGG